MAFYTNGVVPWNSLDDNTRAPLTSEMESGYPCGEADQALFNWTAGYPIGQIYNALLGAGISSPDLSDLKELTQAIQSGNLIYAQATGTANALILALGNGPVSYAQARMVLVNATLANTRSAVTINVNGLGARPIVRRGGDVLRRGDIQPGPMLLLDNGTAYELVGAGGSTRSALKANLTIYVSPTGSNSNDGLDPSSPFLTIQRAWSEIVSNYDLNGFIATIQVADGTYNTALVATSGPVGANSGNASVVIQGNAASPGNVIVAVTGSSAFLAQGGAQFTVKDMRIQTVGADADGVRSGPGGIVTIANLIFGGIGGAALHALGGYISATGNYSITSNSVNHAKATAFGKVSLSTVTVTLTATPAFTGVFAYSQQGRVEAVGTTFSGAATGSRYSVIENGVITVNGAGTTVLPGNAAGSSASGGQYV